MLLVARCLLLLFIILGNCYVVTAQRSRLHNAYSSLEPNAHLSVTSNKDTVFVGQCFVLTAAFNVADDNRARMQFTELGKFVADVLAYDFSKKDCWTSETKIENVVGNPIKIKDTGFMSYEILKVNYCPLKETPIYFPSVEIPMLMISGFKWQLDSTTTIKYFDSKPAVVFVKPIPAIAQYDSAIGYPFAGSYTLYDTILSGEHITNKILPYEITIASDGLTFPIPAPVITMTDVLSRFMSSETVDTVFNGNTASWTTYHYELIFLKKGSYDFNSSGIIHFWDPVQKKSGIIHPHIKVNILSGKKNKVYKFIEKVSEKSNFIAVDVSQSMKIMDAPPTRLGCAKNGIFDFLKIVNNCDIGLIRFGGNAQRLTASGVDSCDAWHLTNQINSKNIPRGTALGNAICLAVQSINKKNVQKKIVVVSDGDNTAGNINLTRAISLAKKNDIQIFTIGIGYPGEVPFKFTLGVPVFVENTFTDVQLKKIAEDCNGKYYYAHNADEVTKILLSIFK